MITGTSLYHRDLGLPKGIKTRFGFIILHYTHHAQKAARTDRYGAIMLPPGIDTSKAEVVEVEVRDGLAVKVLYRVPYSDTHDLCLAVIPQESLVKTVWLNDVKDGHETLVATRYTRPQKDIA